MHASRSAALLVVPLLLLACDKTHAAPSGTDGPPAAGSNSAAGPNVTASGSVTDGAAIDGLPALVQEMRPEFQRCYASALEKDPTMSGSVRVTVDVGSSGAIGSLSTAASKGISKDLASCIDSRVRREKFGAPRGPRSTITISVDLSP